MKNLFNPGDIKKHSFVVSSKDTATFESGQVHPVCATFVLAREIEWATRLFVLEMKDDDEEGIGTMLTINHVGPALVGSVVEIKAIVVSQEKNELICSYVAKVGDKIIAVGETGQKIIKKEKLKLIFENIDTPQNS